jgi:hypothetical protein
MMNTFLLCAFDVARGKPLSSNYERDIAFPQLCISFLWSFRYATSRALLLPSSFFTFQYLIEFHYSYNQLAWVHFFTGLLS